MLLPATVLGDCRQERPQVQTTQLSLGNPQNYET